MFENIIINKLKKQPKKIKDDMIVKFKEKYKDHPELNTMVEDLKKQINYNDEE